MKSVRTTYCVQMCTHYVLRTHCVQLRTPHKIGTSKLRTASYGGVRTRPSPLRDGRAYTTSFVAEKEGSGNGILLNLKIGRHCWEDHHETFGSCADRNASDGHKHTGFERNPNHDYGLL